MDTLWAMEIQKLRLHCIPPATSVVVPSSNATNTFYRVKADYIVH